MSEDVRVARVINDEIYRHDHIFRVIDRPRHLVLDTTESRPDGSVVLGDDWPEDVARPRNDLDGEIVVYGSRRLSHALIGLALVDEPAGL